MSVILDEGDSKETGGVLRFPENEHHFCAVWPKSSQKSQGQSAGLEQFPVELVLFEGQVHGVVKEGGVMMAEADIGEGAKAVGVVNIVEMLLDKSAALGEVAQNGRG